MKLRRTIGAATALLLVACGTARGQGTGAFSGPYLVPRFEAVGFQPRHRTPPAPPRQEAVLYQARSQVPPSSRGTATAHLQLHGGFMERNGNGPTSFAAGVRGGPSIGDVVQLGLGVDWYHESESQRDIVSIMPMGGREITTTNVLARTTADIIPIQAHLQLGGGGRRPLGPYVGVAGGYQYLLLSVADYQTGTGFDATYGGWGWQAWGGLALRLSSSARLFGEVFMNTGNVERDVKDPASGVIYREGTNTDGEGVRFGLNFGI